MSSSGPLKDMPFFWSTLKDRTHASSTEGQRRRKTSFGTLKVARGVKTGIFQSQDQQTMEDIFLYVYSIFKNKKTTYLIVMTM